MLGVPRIFILVAVHNVLSDSIGIASRRYLQFTTRPEATQDDGVSGFSSSAATSVLDSSAEGCSVDSVDS